LLGFFLALPGVPFAMWVYQSWHTDADVAAALAETDRLDPRWRFDDVLADRRPIADADNAALQVQKAKRLLPRTTMNDFAADYEAVLESDPRTPLRPEQLLTLRQALSGRSEAMVEARKLADMPRGRPRIVYAPDFISTLLGPLQDSRDLCTLLQCDVWVRIEEDDYDGAVQSSRAVLNTGRAIGDELCLIAVLVRCATVHLAIEAVERVLAQGEPTAGALAELQTAFEQEASEPVLLTALRGERAGLDKTMQLVVDGKLRASAVARTGGLRGLTPAGRWLFDVVPAQSVVDRAGFLRRMNQLVEATKLPVEEQAAEFQRLHAEEAPPETTLSLNLGHFTATSVRQHLRVQANLRCAIAALAAERYRLQHGGWPESLDALVKDGRLAAVPRDPYDGAPLRFKKTAEGLLVYSIGHDRTDDGGAIQRRFGGEAPPAGTDQGFRLWHVPRRTRNLAAEP
jgi:hypothetical protein